MSTFLAGTRVRLRAADVERDLELFAGWYNDPATRTQLLTPQFAVSASEERRWFGSPSDRSRFSFVIELGHGIAIGNVGLHSVDWINRVAHTVTVIGEVKCRGQGFGSEARRLVIDWAFAELDLVKLSSWCLSENAAMTSMNRR